MSVLVELEKDHLESLEILAKENSKTINYYISEAIEKYLDDLEDAYFSKIAEERLADIESGKSKTIPHSEVKKEYGIYDWMGWKG